MTYSVKPKVDRVYSVNIGKTFVNATTVIMKLLVGYVLASMLQVYTIIHVCF